MQISEGHLTLAEQLPLHEIILSLMYQSIPKPNPTGQMPWVCWGGGAGGDGRF